MNHSEYIQQTKYLIDSLKAICANYGLANTGYEYKVITEVFLYKFINDKFSYEARKAIKELENSSNIEQDLQKMPDSDYLYMLEKIGEKSAKLKKTHFVSHLHNQQNTENFATLFDNTLIEIANLNIKSYSVAAIDGEKIRLFEPISQYIIETRDKSPFCRAIINKLVSFSFEPIFEEEYDFFSTIFEYLITDYNKDSGKYGEYYTPRVVAKIMSKILVSQGERNVRLYDPAAGSGSLLLSLAHQIGEDKCTIYSQDISQKSSEFLRLNLILNNLVHSLNNVIKGNALTNPYHKNDEKNDLKKFDYIVSNPPFKMDFSDDRETLASDIHKKRFFAGVPKILKKDKDKMAVYLLFIQHILYSLTPLGKAAVVVPTGFLTAHSGIENRIRKKLVDEKMLLGVISMPSNIFATTGTSVSVIFIGKSNVHGQVVLMDASKLGTVVKEGKNQKTLLSSEEEQLIIDMFNKKEVKENFSVVIDYEKIEENKYSFSAGQYFEVNIEYDKITPQEFATKIGYYTNQLNKLFEESKKQELVIKNRLDALRYE